MCMLWGHLNIQFSYRYLDVLVSFDKKAIISPNELPSEMFVEN